MTAAGANVLAYSAHKTRTEGRQWSSRQLVMFYATCTVTNFAGVGLFAMSTIFGGAVATVMPMQTGANLLSNMCLQISLGIKTFTKEMRVGTFILLCAVGELSQIGPQEPPDLDLHDLMAQPLAIPWVIAMLVALVLGMIQSWATLHHEMGSLQQLVSLT